MHDFFKYLGCLVFLLATELYAQNTPAIAYIGEAGCMEYTTDTENNYLPDFSHAGYKGGGVALPEVPTLLTINPISGDNTSHIQNALDSMAKLPLNDAGIRGALLLDAGIYEVHGQLFIKESGITLRGMGQTTDSAASTIIKGIGNTPNLRDLIIAGGATNSWSNAVPNTYINITISFIPAGARSLELITTAPFKVGDQIIIVHPSTDKWLASIDYGNTDTDAPWTPGTIDIYYNRYITEINEPEKKVILDAPIFDHFDQTLSQPYIYKLNEPNIKKNIGIENLRIEIVTNGELTEDHAKSAIALKGVEDCWVTNVTAKHFYYAAVYTTAASRVTIKDCRGIEPHSEITGARRYNFAANARSNNILFDNCHASYGRHSFVSNGTSSVSGIVFYNCSSEHDYAASEGHRRWSQGLLFDNIEFTGSETDQLLGLYNRGRYGTGHGWACTNCVAWNVNTNTIFRKIIIQKPPHRQNYAIGCNGLVTNAHQFSNPIGYIELSKKEVTPTSLYEIQLKERLQNGSRPDGPAKLVANINGDNNAIQLNWLDIAGNEESYTVEISTDKGQTYSVLTNLPPNSTTFKIENWEASTDSLSFRVTAKNEVCQSPYSNPAFVQQTVSNHTIPISEISIYPNPIKNQLFIKSELLLKTIHIYDNKGVLVLDKDSTFSGIAKISTTNFAKGIYLLKIKDKADRVGNYKLVKQ